MVSADLQTATCYVINVTSPAGMKGDVDDNGVINISDVTLLITHVMNGGGNINTDNADMDDNGTINITDVTMLITHVMTH